MTCKNWQKEIKKDDGNSLMTAVKENEKVGMFGGIKSTNANIHEHGGVNGAIEDMVTGAQEKGIMDAEHAKNLREKYGKNLNKVDQTGHSNKTLEDVADAMSKGKLDSDAATVGEFDNAKDYASATAAMAAKKAAEMKTGEAAMKKTGMLDDNGQITQAAEDAMQRKEERAEREQMSSSDFLNNKKMLQEIFAKMIDKFGGKKAVDQMVKDGFLANGDVKFDNGKAVVDSITPADADSVSMAVGNSQGHKLGESMKSMIINGYAVKNHGDAVTGDKNNQVKEHSGTSLDAAVDQYFYKNLQAKENFERAKENMNLKNDMIRLASEGQGPLSHFIQKHFNVSKEQADKDAMGIIAAGGILTATELGTAANNLKNGKVTTQKLDSDGNKLFKDADGNTVKQNAAGEFFTQDADGKVKTYEGDAKALKPQKRLLGGAVSENVRKVGGRMFKKGDEDLGGKPSPDSVDSSSSVSSNSDQPKENSNPDKSVDPKHGDSFNSNSKDSIAQEPNPGKGLDNPEYLQKKAALDEVHAKQNALNPNNEHILKRQALESKSLEDMYKIATPKGGGRGAAMVAMATAAGTAAYELYEHYFGNNGSDSKGNVPHNVMSSKGSQGAFNGFGEGMQQLEKGFMSGVKRTFTPQAMNNVANAADFYMTYAKTGFTGLFAPTDLSGGDLQQVQFPLKANASGVSPIASSYMFASNSTPFSQAALDISSKSAAYAASQTNEGILGLQDGIDLLVENGMRNQEEYERNQNNGH